MSAVDTAYTVWGVAQPCAPKVGPVKWLRDDCDKARTLSPEALRAVIGSLQGGPCSDYADYWLEFYRRELERRTQ